MVTAVVLNDYLVSLLFVVVVLLSWYVASNALEAFNNG